MTRKRGWLFISGAVVVGFLVFGAFWYVRNGNQEEAARALSQRLELCEQQHTTVEILRLFLVDHEDLRTEVPPAEHPGTLRLIQRLLDEADCDPTMIKEE